MKSLPLLAAIFALAFCATANGQGMSAFGTMDYGRPMIPLRGTVVSVSGQSARAAYSASVHPRMIAAARIADASAERGSTRKCWRYVKRALLRANAVSSYPGTVYAKQAGRELTSTYGFVRLHVRNPYKAPVGSVLVYGGKGAGHVEIRTERGFVSDYRSRRPCGLPFIGAFTKAS